MERKLPWMGRWTGMLLLVVCRAYSFGFIERYVWQHPASSGVMVRMALWAVPGIWWGWMLGYRAGLALEKWGQSKRSETRAMCRDYGLVYSTVILTWGILVVTFLTTMRDGGMHLAHFLSVATCYCLANGCLQGAVLMLVTGYGLPRDFEDSVQITEKLRL